MAVVKNLNTDYTITNKSSSLANIFLATHTVYVDGNLIVGGNTTTVTKTELNVTDNLIVLNSGETGAGVTLGNAGIQVDRGSVSDVQLVYNETWQKWILTNDGTTYANIATSTGSGAVSIIGDPAPQLGGNLDVLSRSIFSSTTPYIKHDTNISIKTTSVAPSASSNYTVLYAQDASTGGSGLYVTNNQYAEQELATKMRSVAYSIIFS